MTRIPPRTSSRRVAVLVALPAVGLIACSSVVSAAAAATTRVDAGALRPPSAAVSTLLPTQWTVAGTTAASGLAGKAPVAAA